MFDFLKGIIIFITTITLPINGLFVHSKPVTKPILTPTPTISVNISFTPKNSPSTQTKEASTKPSVAPVLSKNLQKIKKIEQVRQQIQEKLNSQPTSAPAQINTPTTTPTATQETIKTPKDLMPDKPVIDSFCDNKGNCVHSQFADPNSSSSLSTYPTVHVGETLNFIIKVSGEGASGVLAFIISQGYDGGNLGRKPWSTDLTYTKNFSKEDVSTSGYPIYAYIKSQNDNYHRRPVCNWTDYPCDDSATLYYNVLP